MLIFTKRDSLIFAVLTIINCDVDLFLKIIERKKIVIIFPAVPIGMYGRDVVPDDEKQIENLSRNSF